MVIKYLPQFKKQYKRLPNPIQAQFDERLRLFVVDPTDRRLRIHPLKGSFSGYWSMDINGDIRALYFFKNDEIVIFALIGTHSELYG